MEQKNTPRPNQDQLRIAQENYLEAGKSANQFSISLLIFVLGALFAFGVVNTSGLSFWLATSLIASVSLSILFLIVHKMRQMYFFMGIINDCKKDEQGKRQESYEDREKFCFNIPRFLFLFYFFALLSFILLPVSVSLTMSEKKTDTKQSPPKETVQSGRDYKPDPSEKAKDLTTYDYKPDPNPSPPEPTSSKPESTKPTPSKDKTSE